MRDTPPCLINHLPRTASGEIQVDAATPDGSNVTPDLDADARGGGNPADRSTETRPLVETLWHVDWMRPATLAGPASPQTTAAATTEQTLACSGTAGDKSSEHRCLERIGKLLQRRHGISADAATALCLAALSTAAGPSRTLKSPLGGCASAALNVIVEDANNARIRRAADQVLHPILRQAEKRILAHQEAGPKHLRRLRIEIDTECARVVSRIRSPPERPREPIPVPAEQRKAVDLAEAMEEAAEVTQRLGLHEFEERPFIVVDGLRAADIAELPQRSFDGAILNYSPHGALGQFDSRRVEDRREVLRYMVAAWHRSPFVAGTNAVVAPVLTNLWLHGRGDTARAWRNPVIAASGLMETFLVIDDGDTKVDIHSYAETDADNDWRTLLEITLGERVRGETCEHHLSEPAAKRFLEFHAQTIQAAANIMGLWPEQALKIALLLHLDWLSSEAPAEIDLSTVEKAIQITERLGAAQLRASQNAPGDELETQIELMVTKVRVKGPMPVWGLYRSFHSHPVDIMKPLLALCCERKLLQIEDSLVRLPDAAQ